MAPWLVLLLVSCSGSSEDSGEASTTTGTGSSSEATGQTEGETGAGADCAEATDAAACDAAANLAEGGPCSWLVIYEMTSTGPGDCNYVETSRGVCVGRNGLDDGCNANATICGNTRDAYFKDTGVDTWEMLFGHACRGVPGYELCLDETELPCACACEDLP